MVKEASQNLCESEVEIVENVENQNEVEETTENFMEPSTQYVLEVEPVQEPERKSSKGKGKSSMLALNKKKITTHPLMQWLCSIWLADTTLRVMKPWLKAINAESLKTKNQKLFLVGQTISQIMKQFFLHMKDAKKSLTDCSYGAFEEWCLREGLSMMSGKLPGMVWEDDIQNLLFSLYSDSIIELRMEESDEEDEEMMQIQTKKRSTYQESLSSRNTKNISMSSTIAPTVEAHTVTG